jgi:hypothetical protein
MPMSEHDINEWGIALVEHIDAIVSGETAVGDVPIHDLFMEQSAFKKAWTEGDIEEVLAPLHEARILTDQQVEWLEEYFAEIAAE